LVTAQSGTGTASARRAPPRWGAAAEIIELGIAAGLLTGCLQVVILWVTRFGVGRLVFHSRDALWMAPLANALLFAGLALLVAVGALLIRHPLVPVLAAGGFGFLGIFSLLLPFGAIARWAAGLVALAGAIQLARHYQRAGPRRRRRTARVASLGIGASILLLALGQRGLRTLQRAMTLRGLPAASAGAPNVLLIILDTVRGEELSLYGYPKPTTPHLTKWAAQGTVFEHAIASAPWTLPSHGTIFTGQLGERLGGTWLTPVRIATPTLAEVLRSRGYRTAGFTGNLLYTSYESGLTRGFIDFHDYPVSLKQIFLHAPIVQTVFFQSIAEAQSRYDLKQAVRKLNLHTVRLPADEYVPAQSITDRFLHWQAAVGSHPYFAFLNYFDAHAPYRSPPAFRAVFASGDRGRNGYDAAIAFLDSELDRLFDTLQQRGVLDRTIIVVGSDHGELFGEHGLRGHANSLFLPLLRVPLVLRYPPRVPAGRRIAEVVSLRDLPATILALAGSPSDGLSGISLSRTWMPPGEDAPGSPPISQVIKSREGDAKGRNATTWLESILDERYHYIRSGLGKEELYAWRTDSLELIDLAGTPLGKDVARDLRARLEAERSGRGLSALTAK
jgi:arylsulfatase A-like enzyme